MRVTPYRGSVCKPGKFDAEDRKRVKVSYRIAGGPRDARGIGRRQKVLNNRGAKPRFNLKGDHQAG